MRKIQNSVKEGSISREEIRRAIRVVESRKIVALDNWDFSVAMTEARLDTLAKMVEDRPDFKENKKHVLKMASEKGMTLRQWTRRTILEIYEKEKRRRQKP